MPVVANENLDVDSLVSWLHDEYIFDLVLKAESVCKTYVGIMDQDEAGQPTQCAVDAMSDISELEKGLNVFKAVKQQIDNLVNTQ